MRGLYIHIPFCLSKCPYCDFYSVKYGRAIAEEYKKAVIRNLKHYAENKFDTVYFGGGTPILLWREICEIISDISLSENAEITVEANPCTTLKENLTELRRSGVNRISLGVQSLSDSELTALGRRHTAAAAVNAIETAYNCGFKNISADIMLGTPLQTSESLNKTIEKLSKLPITHISAYMLKIEENTPFASAKLSLPDEDTICDMYLNSVAALDRLGFKQYEISNFARDNHMCRHNMKYWSCEEYLGIGPAAHSYYNGERFFVKRDLEDFISSESQKTYGEEKDNNRYGGYEEYAMLRLRLTQGLSLREYAARGGDSEKMLRLTSRIPKKYYTLKDDNISLTPMGFLVSNAIIAVLLGY